MKDLEEMYVAVVDANEDTRELTCRYLVHCGIPSNQIIEFTESPRARDFLNSVKVDLVIADRMLPELSGVGLAHSIRASKKLDDVYILILTCNDDNNDIVEAGADFLQKPFSLSHLSSVVQASRQTPQIK